MAGHYGRGADADLNAQMGELQMGENGDMLIDELDPVDEKTDVAIINTPEDSVDDAEVEPRADDCTIAFPPTSDLHCANAHTDEAMKAKVLPQIQDLEIDTEEVSTWSIDDWRALKNKERGPIFYCGGQPWYVSTVDWDI